jgi:hypothetical protein
MLLTFPLLLSFLFPLSPPDSGCPPSFLYQQVYALVCAEPALREFLDLGPSTIAAQELMTIDTLYTIDRFPFDVDTVHSAISVYRADMLRPLRTRYAPFLSRNFSYVTPQGVMFVSFVENGDILSEVFRTRKGTGSYEEYRMSAEGLKFLLTVSPDCSVHVVRHVLLLR